MATHKSSGMNMKTGNMMSSKGGGHMMSQSQMNSNMKSNTHKPSKSKGGKSC